MEYEKTNIKEEQIKLIEYYLKDDSKKLKNIANKILNQLNEKIYDLDYEDFYSLAGEILWIAVSS